MQVTFDHLVHLTASPREAKAAFAQMGFHAVQGGIHHDWGTYNCLCYFRDLRYIEWIGFMDLNKAKKSDNRLIQQIVTDSAQGAGFSQIAFRTNDIHAIMNHISEKGLTPIGPFAGNRQREDGTVLSWSMLFIRDESHRTYRYPFFIQWGQQDSIRKQEMKQLMQHHHGQPTLSYIGIQADHLDESVQKYCHLFDISSSLVRYHADRFGSYAEIPAGHIKMRFYESAKLSSGRALYINRPFLCGITGMPQNQTILLEQAIYDFSV
ncbi:hypothetical protein AT864_01836 [Anoxybacillus sp. P3H1B]|uniref:VOC family protein n=1 Tax=Anoxybacillaceae TaxID=3120669 RepID=UPI000794029C|nr:MULTISPECIES: VOC family protein [Anoxybacillus]KXG09877.1 hypothetical protein AT864_01836 [Anoxybacillus sp. P3H1B]